jgi:transposase InsO family protein
MSHPSVLSKSPSDPDRADSEVLAKPERRRFTATYKLRILQEAEQCANGELGALLRREGLYSSHLSTWRRQREAGRMNGLTPRRRGPKPDLQAAELAQLRRENERLKRKLQQAEVIIDAQKKACATLRRDARRERESDMIQSAEDLALAVGVSAACRALRVARSGLYRRRHPHATSLPRPRPPPARALSPVERAQVRDVLNSPRFEDCAPQPVYATLLDEGTYLCSISSLYRILRQNSEIRERRNQLRHPTFATPRLMATAPNQVWTWDITKLRGPVTWSVYYLYVLLDLYSRFVVGWLIAQQESAQLAQALIAESCARQGILRGQLTVHADRGGPMTAKSLALLLADLEVNVSHSRPRTSNDNPFSEAQFKTAKYHPSYPDFFDSLPEARTWGRHFFPWYNFEHRHVGVGLLTSATVHFGWAPCLREKRELVLSHAYQAYPERFVRGRPTPPELPVAVWINPPPEVLAFPLALEAPMTLAESHELH